MERKQLPVKINTVNESDRTIDFIISDESLDRDEDIILTSAWDFSEFQKNPQFLGFHNYQDYPLGKPIAWGVDDRAKKTWMRVKFPSIEELATIPEAASEKAKLVDTVYNMYRIKMLNAVSVGFSADEIEPHRKQVEGRIPRGKIVKKCKLLEVSAVPVPANPNAVSMVKSFSGESFDYVSRNIFEDAMDTKSVIPFKHWPLAEESASWDGPSVVAASSPEELKIICTWYDSESSDTKNAYKLPHHMTKGDGYKTVWAGVRAAMAALMGARGGVDIPDDEKEKAFNHLAKHYKEFGKDIPEYKAYKEKMNMDFEELNKKIADLEAEVKSLKEPETKANRRLSKASMAMIEACNGHMEKAMGCIKDLISSGVVETEDNDIPSGVEKAGDVPETKSIDLSSMTLDQANEYLRQNGGDTAKE